MNYSLQNLTQVADCQTLLDWAAKEKADLTFKKLSDERMTTKFTQASQDIETELQSVISELQALETIIAALPDGPTKNEEIIKRTRTEYKKFVLETRKESYGTVALLEKEMDLARVIRELAEVDEFVAAVEEKMATLAA